MIDWQAAGQDYADIVYETAEGIAKITINRPEVRNAFRPATLSELSAAFTELGSSEAAPAFPPFEPALTALDSELLYLAATVLESSAAPAKAAIHTTRASSSFISTAD